MGPVKNPNCKFTFVQLVKLLVLFPFFSVKTAADYADSALGKLFSCKKDSFYRLMDDGRIDWRRIIYSINRQLIGTIKMGKTKYETALGNLSAPDIIKRIEKAKATKRNRSIGYTCASIKARYTGMDVQLFFYKKGFRPARPRRSGGLNHLRKLNNHLYPHNSIT